MSDRCGLPAPIRRREHSRPERVIGTAFARFVLRPLFWLLRPFGVWPDGAMRLFNRVVEKLENFSPSEHDVLICSFFKSGTNWAMQIALQIAWRGNAQYQHIHDLVPWIELPERGKPFAVPVSDALWQNCPTQLRISKTHLRFGKIEYNDAGRYVWVVRDPKDVFVSSYHFVDLLLFGPLMPSLDEWLDIFLSENSLYGSWAEHLHSGWQARECENVLFLTFEEMKRDRAGSIDRIAKLMNVDLAAEERDEVIRQSAFEHMKQIGEKFDSTGLSPPWAQSRGTMVRRGRAGGSGELLTPDQQRRIDAYWRGELRRLGSDFPYDDHYG